MTPEARTRLVEVMAKAISPWAFNTEARGGWWLRHMLGSQRDARNHAENAIAAAEREGFRFLEPDDVPWSIRP